MTLKVFCLKVTFLVWYHSSVCVLTSVRHAPFLTECFLLPPLPFSLLYKIHPNKLIFYKAGGLAGTRYLGSANAKELKVAIKDFANTICTRGIAAAFFWLFWLKNSLSQAEADYIGHTTKVIYSLYTKSPIN